MPKSFTLDLSMHPFEVWSPSGEIEARFSNERLAADFVVRHRKPGWKVVSRFGELTHKDCQEFVDKRFNAVVKEGGVNGSK